MQARTCMRFVAAVAGLPTAATACSGNVPDRAGGTVITKVTVLTLADNNDGPPAQLADWINEVHNLSLSSMRIELKNAWLTVEPGNEAQTVQDVRPGKVDMAWVGARVMDRVGVTSFQALLAPMLVESYGLETSVFQADFPAQMFTGARIAEQDSALTQTTLQTLGDTAVPVPGAVKIHGVDGYEQQLESIGGNRYDTIAKFTTANLNLWPRPLVIIMGMAAWAKLAGTQRDTLRKAADAALLPAIDASRQEDQQALPVLCKSGVSLPTALPQQLADLRTAVQPVYVSLRRDASTSKWPDQIQALKEQLHADPEAASCAGVSGASQPASQFDGTYWRRSGAADNVTACHGKLPPATGPIHAHTTLAVVLDHDVTSTSSPMRDEGHRLARHPPGLPRHPGIHRERHHPPVHRHLVSQRLDLGPEQPAERALRRRSRLGASLDLEEAATPHDRSRAQLGRAATRTHAPTIQARYSLLNALCERSTS